jgi:hypothetical protein
MKLTDLKFPEMENGKSQMENGKSRSPLLYFSDLSGLAGAVT